MPAVDSPVGVPVKSQTIGLGEGYRDPTMFRYSCFSRPNIDPCPTVHFVASTSRFVTNNCMLLINIFQHLQ